ncbi:MAG: 2-oxo-4-hydroxy-4-carboxy-5-ureidoimidazoline decarboxylase [Gemmatimonadaceae bacterium]
MTDAGDDEAIARLDALPRAEAEAALLACCGSSRWARQVEDRRPFASADALRAAADEVWWSLGPGDWLEAFRAHPRIGEREAAAPRGAGSRAWSDGEQAGMRDAAAEVRAALAEGNREYEARFGHIFIVCATGRSAGEMLALLTRRLGNEPAEELRAAAEEQRKITRLRLDKLLDTRPAPAP